MSCAGYLQQYLYQKETEKKKRVHITEVKIDKALAQPFSLFIFKSPSSVSTNRGKT